LEVTAQFSSLPQLSTHFITSDQLRNMFSVLLTVTSPSASFKVSQEQKSWSQASCLTTRELPPAHSLAHSEARCCFHIFHVYIYIFTVALYL